MQIGSILRPEGTEFVLREMFRCLPASSLATLKESLSQEHCATPEKEEHRCIFLAFFYQNGI